jgi:hypothetical protein
MEALGDITMRYPKKEYPIHVNRFHRMQSRVRAGHTTTVWPRDLEGFCAFLEEIGPVPLRMIQPSVGRKDHSRGYEPGNIEWQETKDNRLDGCLRMSDRTRGRPLSDEHRQKLIQNHGMRGKAPWNLGKAWSEESRRKISEAKKGRSTANKGKPKSQETRQKFKDSWAQTRELRREALRRGWQKRKARQAQVVYSGEQT